MPDVSNPADWKLVSAALMALGALIYVFYRTGQLARLISGSKAFGAHFRREQSLLENKLCPDFDAREIETARQTYVKPDCSQIDPANEQQMHGFASVREQVFRALDRYIDDATKQHIIILADSGMGKTTLCLNYYAGFKRDGLDIALISLSRPDPEAKIGAVPSKRSTALLLDAFDEDSEAIKSGTSRLYDLLGLCASFPTVVVTCRSQFFENDAAIPTHTGIARITPSSGKEGAYYELSRIYLLPFDSGQIGEYLRRRFRFFSLFGWLYRSRARTLIKRIPELSVRPMLLALVPDLVRENKSPNEVFELYEYMVGKWLARESRWVEESTLSRVSTDLALLLSERRLSHDSDRISPADLQDQQEFDFSGIEWSHLTTRSLLNRDSEGRLKFAHRSVMEYLVVRALLDGNPSATSVPWTDFMKELLISFSNISTTNLDAARLAVANHFHDKSRGKFTFPIGEPLASPAERSVEAFRSFASQPPRSLFSRREIPLELRDATIELRKEAGHLHLHDFEYDLSWRVPDLTDSRIISDYELYRSSLSDVLQGRFAEDYELPSFPEFLSLLRLQGAFPSISLIRDFDYYWLGDSMRDARHMIVSVNRDLKAIGVIEVLTDAPVSQTSKTINLYAIDAYRQRNTLKNLRALELRVRRGSLRRAERRRAES